MSSIKLHQQSHSEQSHSEQSHSEQSHSAEHVIKINNRRELGQYAEQKSLEYLYSQGYNLIARNWKGERGEIDLIMTQDQSLIWIEVRSVGMAWLTHALQAITPQKCRQVARCAQEFIMKESLYLDQFTDFRFDVVAVALNYQSDRGILQAPSLNFTDYINHIPNAFYASWAF